VVSEPVVTGTGIPVDFEEQIGGLRDVDILLGSKVPNYGEAAIYLVSDTRIGDIRLRDDGNALRAPNMGIAFSLWVNKLSPPLGVVGWPRADDYQHSLAKLS
jgi:hypothetical protein